jgi:hypothetical protein
MLRKRIKKGNFAYQVLEMENVSSSSASCAPIGDVGMMDIFHLEGMGPSYIRTTSEFSFETQNGGVICYHVPSASSRFLSIPFVPEPFAIGVAIVLLSSIYHISDVDNLLDLVRVQKCIDELFRYEMFVIKNPLSLPPATSIVYRFPIVSGMEFIGTRYIAPDWIIEWSGNTPYYSMSISAIIVRALSKVRAAFTRRK